MLFGHSTAFCVRVPTLPVIGIFVFRFISDFQVSCLYLPE